MKIRIPLPAILEVKKQNPEWYRITIEKDSEDIAMYVVDITRTEDGQWLVCKGEVSPNQILKTIGTTFEKLKDAISFGKNFARWLSRYHHDAERRPSMLDAKYIDIESVSAGNRLHYIAEKNKPIFLKKEPTWYRAILEKDHHQIPSFVVDITRNTRGWTVEEGKIEIGTVLRGSQHSHVFLKLRTALHYAIDLVKWILSDYRGVRPKYDSEKYNLMDYGTPNEQYSIEASLVGPKVSTSRLHRGITDPDDYLVVTDYEDPNCYHLPVYEDGIPNKRLMGNAWAALMHPNGFRGQPYKGPEKSKAIKKLKALYKQLNIATPKLVSQSSTELKFIKLGKILRIVLSEDKWGAVEVVDIVKNRRAYYVMNGDVSESIVLTPKSHTANFMTLRAARAYAMDYAQWIMDGCGKNEPRSFHSKYTDLE